MADLVNKEGGPGLTVVSDNPDIPQKTPDEIYHESAAKMSMAARQRMVERLLKEMGLEAKRQEKVPLKGIKGDKKDNSPPQAP